MGSTWTIEVGHSTWALAGDDVEVGVAGAAAAGGVVAGTQIRQAA